MRPLCRPNRRPAGQLRKACTGQAVPWYGHLTEGRQHFSMKDVLPCHSLSTQCHACQARLSNGSGKWTVSCVALKSRLPRAAGSCSSHVKAGCFAPLLTCNSRPEKQGRPCKSQTQETWLLLTTSQSPRRSSTQGPVEASTPPWQDLLLALPDPCVHRNDSRLKTV